MSTLTEPPIYSQMVDDDRKAMIPWVLHFNQLYNGDQGTSWVPTFTGLTSTGTPSFTGVHYRISSKLVYFRIVVTPATNTTATFGTTYVDNFPLLVSADGQCSAVSGTNGSAVGIVKASTGRIYVPGWTSIAIPVTITGTIEAS